jgi:uncharacterized integral membrane protein
VKWVKILVWTVVFILAVFFAMQNREEVTLRFGFHPFWDFGREMPRVPLFLAVLCSIFLGVLIGGIGDFYRHIQLKRTLRQNQKTIERLEREVGSLRGRGSDQSPPKEQADL